METIKLTADKRNVLGKRNRFLRRQGITPVHVFGHNQASLSLQCDTVQLNRILAHAGTTRLISLSVEGEKRPKNVFVREVQKDTLGKHLLHVDFYQVKEGEKMMVEVPIVLVGEAPAMKGKGHMLTHGITSLHVECLPEKVPPQIEVDISILEDVEQPINVKDIVLDPDVTVHADPEQLIVKVTEVMVKAEAEEEAAAEEAEGEAEATAEGAAEQPAEASSEEAS